MNLKCMRWLALSGLLLAGAAAAEGFALGVKAGTLGAGLEATYGLSPRFNLRLGINSYTYEYDETTSGIRYDAELDLGSGALLLDWHPFAGVFRVSLGYMRNDNILRLTATPTGDQEIGGNTYTPTDIGTLSGEMTFAENVPYFGIGWGNAARGKGVGFSFELGAMFQDSPQVALRGNGGRAGDPQFENDLRREEREIEEDLKEFKVYPVVSFGLSYHF